MEIIPKTPLIFLTFFQKFHPEEFRLYQSEIKLNNNTTNDHNTTNDRTTNPEESFDMDSDIEFISEEIAKSGNIENALKELSKKPSFQVLTEKYVHISSIKDGVIEAECRLCVNNKALRACFSYFGNWARHLQVFLLKFNWQIFLNKRKLVIFSRSENVCLE